MHSRRRVVVIGSGLLREGIRQLMLVAAVSRALIPAREEPSFDFTAIPQERMDYEKPYTRNRRAQDRVRPVKAFSKGRKKTWGRQ